MRTVKRSTLSLNDKKRKNLSALCLAYTREKRSWLERFRGWDYMPLVGSPRTLRDACVKEKYQSPHGLQARHWKLALQDAAETWDKYWQAIFVQVRAKISHRKDLSEEELHYAYWLLTSYPAFVSMMQGKVPLPSFPIEEMSKKRIASYVRRLIRQCKGKAPTLKKARSVRFDADCYEVFIDKDRQYIKLMSLIPGKRIVIPLSGKAAITGTITLILSEEEAHIHVSQELNKKATLKTSIEAVDFGYTEVMTDTEGMRYGTQFGVIHTESTEKRTKKMQKRHKLYALVKKKKIAHPTQVKRIQKYNLGKKKLYASTQCMQATLEKEINTAINQLIETKNPAALVTEDLHHVFTYNKGKKMNRKLSSWLRGKLQDRITFKALAEGFRHEQINPAYGSQSCPYCEFVDPKNRNKDRFQCLNCRHEDMADRIAALNYARRLGDPEIGRYTPYRQVKTILLSRFHRRLETGPPVTVPGRTLETVVEVYPPSLPRPYVIAGRKKFRKPGSPSESETKNKHV